jgi:hypothetical protein
MPDRTPHGAGSRFAAAVCGVVRLGLAPLLLEFAVHWPVCESMRVAAGRGWVCPPERAVGGGQPWGGAIADDPAAFADAAVALYTDKAAWTRAQGAGVAITRAMFDYEGQGARVMRAIAATLQRCVGAGQGVAWAKQGVAWTFGPPCPPLRFACP